MAFQKGDSATYILEHQNNKPTPIQKKSALKFTVLYPSRNSASKLWTAPEKLLLNRRVRTKDRKRMQ